MNYIINTCKHYPLPSGFLPVYGTSGFRADASLLHSTMFRTGVLIAIRAMNCAKHCGVMITASHNKDTDNGVKLIDCTGELIDEEWEEYSTHLCQISDPQEFIVEVVNIVNRNPPCSTIGSARVIIGYDTRCSSVEFANICKVGVLSCGVEAIEAGLVTTPELQYHVHLINMPGTYHTFPAKSDMYILNLLHTFRDLVSECNHPETHLHVDCANGVGAYKLKVLAPMLSRYGLVLHLYNTGEGRLNHLCGSDYVEKQQRFPFGMDGIQEGDRCCSIDGDADRIVYFTKQNDAFCMLSGDKIASLLALYTSAICREMDPHMHLSMGVVQTAYANGASTHYMRSMIDDLKIECTPTGVKHLHHAAKHYDIGVYFEANGHGTVLLKPEFIERVRRCYGNKNKLISLSMLLSQVTGDALADMLAVEAILMSENWTFRRWVGLYEDLPCKQIQLKKDRSKFVTTDAERRCLKPEGLQEEIDRICSQHNKARCFVRPSGTEDVVRIYVEAENKKGVDAVSENVVDTLQRL